MELKETHLESLNILDTMEEVEANTQENQLAGALAVKELGVKVTAMSYTTVTGTLTAGETTKVQIDNILKLLNDAAEYRSSGSNIKLQWIMMIVTILSLFVALSSIINGKVVSEMKSFIEWIKTIMVQ